MPDRIMNTEQVTSKFKIFYTPLDIQKHLAEVGDNNGSNTCP